jgi:hypothetical protein
MTGVAAMTPKALGERHAKDWYARVGGLLVTRKQTYDQAINALEKLCVDRMARRAFDRCLGQIVAGTPGTLVQPPKRTPRARQRKRAG